MQMQIQTPTSDSVDETLRVQELQKKRRKQKMILSIILILACLVFLGFWVFKNKKDLFGLEALIGRKKKENAGTPADSSGVSEEELFQLAVDIKKAGLIVQGVMQCGWTRKQLDLFGPPGSKARTEFEKVYVECVSREVCQDVRGFPTWARGKLQFPGYRDVDKIRELIAETKNLPVQQQVMGASLPLEENIPDAQHAVPGPKTANDEKIEADERIQEIIEENEEQAKKDAEAQTEPEPQEKQVVKTPTSGTSKKRKLAPKKENVRGVSAYPPLNVPNMPGAYVMSIDTSYAENQVLQGNVPRESMENPNPVEALANQMAATFEQIAYDAARDPSAALYSNARMPQSASITTGDPMASKRIYVEKNT